MTRLNDNIQPLSVSEKYFVLVLIILYTSSLFLNLGLQPLYLEEPRRALIALEMIFNKNFAIPTEFGELYFKKPPLWNWMIILSYNIFGSYSEFAVRFFTPVSLLITGFIIYIAGKKYVNERFGITSAFLFLVSIDIYYYFSMLGEIDIFYSLITFASFISIFHFYKKQNLYALFIVTYALGALGWMTKAFPSVVFTGLSLVVFFIYQKKIKLLFSWPHLAGIATFLIIIGGYFLAYSRSNNAGDLISILWSRSSQRTALENTLSATLTNLAVFPLDVMKNLFPAILFFPLLFIKNFRKTIRSNDFIRFSLIIFIVNILVYWISPGTRQRYIYMLYPLIINVLLYFYIVKSSENIKISMIYNKLLGGIILISPALPLLFLIMPQFSEIKHLTALCVMTSLFIACGLFFNKIVLHNKLFTLIYVFIIIRILYDLTIVPHRNIYSDAKTEKDQAYAILDEIHDNPIHLYGSTTCSRITVFYLERETKKVVDREYKMEEGDYYIVDNKHIITSPHDTVMTFSQEFAGDFLLIRNRHAMD